MNSLIIAGALLATTLPQYRMSPADALHIARTIGDYAGYTASEFRKIDYEITDKAGHPTYTGYTTVQMMANGHAIFDLSIMTRTGQVVDFNRCLVFQYSVIRKAETGLWIRRGRDALYVDMMGDNGCDRYRVLRHPGDEAKASPIYSSGPE